MTGEYYGTIDLDPGTTTYIVASGPYNDALVAAYSKTDGSFRWGRTFRQPGTDESAIPRAAVDPVTGDVYVGTNFCGTIDFTPGIPGDEFTSAGDRDALVVKLDPQGGFLNAWRFSGPGLDSAARIAGVVRHTVYVAGRIDPGTADFPNGDTLAVAVGEDMYVMALDEAALPPSPLLAASVPVKPVDQSLSGSEYQLVDAVFSPLSDHRSDDFLSTLLDDRRLPTQLRLRRTR